MTDEQKAVEELALELISAGVINIRCDLLAMKLIDKGYRKSPSSGLEKLDEIVSEYNKYIQSGCISIKEGTYVSQGLWNAIEKYATFGRPKGLSLELINACKEWIQWFDYLSAYQNENLGKGLKEAEYNWDNMLTPDPSPSIERLKQALKNAMEEK